jgi:hypothetical protein
VSNPAQEWRYKSKATKNRGFTKKSGEQTEKMWDTPTFWITNGVFWMSIHIQTYSNHQTYLEEFQWTKWILYMSVFFWFIQQDHGGILFGLISSQFILYPKKHGGSMVFYTMVTALSSPAIRTTPCAVEMTTWIMTRSWPEIRGRRSHEIYRDGVGDSTEV